MSYFFRHRVNFYFDSNNYSNYKICNQILDWINLCFDKNTNRYFYLGSVKKIDNIPTNGYAYMLPAFGFEIDVYLTNMIGGYSLFFPEGKGVVVCGFKTLDLATKNSILHELGHVFGVAIGEYYKSANVVDLTGVNPPLKVSSYRNDDYWSLRESWKQDVMLNILAGNPTWSPLSKLVIDRGVWRLSGPPLPDITKIPIKSEYKKAKIKIYRFSKYTGFDLMDQSESNEDGEFVLDWQTNPSVAISQDQMRKIIINDSAVKGISIFDVQLEYLQRVKDYQIII